ncbi:hypothetical protein F9817_06825 [Vibrio sp. CAIM 722]|uniref:Uncharacterized protein n=1 Tax=Vibrio eleionomae TaxID=2653505 RepID=A0A7X4LJ57_9VIBR|nr:hypothetical protein [Vibrio eleionomae]MZI92908.1 hypothetical protein [Vibrio eleionomae]
MYEQVEKPKENKSRAVDHSVAQKKNQMNQSYGFVDNRPELILQQRLKGKLKTSNVQNGIQNQSFIIQRNQFEQLKVEEKPFIFKKNIRPYVDENQFGHVFTIELGILAPEELLWLEKTDKPYLSSMQADSWNNMANIGAGSNVFSDWENVVGEVEYKTVKFVDPPSIKKTPNNYRKLEFYIHVLGNERKDMITLTAIQELQTDGDGEISKSSFSFLDEKVYKSGSSEDTELSNPYWDDDE